MLTGLGLLYLAVSPGDSSGWGVRWYDPVVGLVALPAISALRGLAARRFSRPPGYYAGQAPKPTPCYHPA